MKKVLEGILKEIGEVETVYILKTNKVVGPAGRSWYELQGIDSKLIISSGDKESAAINFPGIILPDSIGHHIEVYCSDDNNINRGYIIKDKSIGREYKATKSW